MLTVNGNPIYVDELEVLRNIKEQVLQQQEREILRKIKKSGQNIMVCCPIHHDGQERKPSCGILLTNKKDHKAGEFHCFCKNTEIITYDGIKSIAEIIGKPIKILNGNGEWEYTIFKSYGIQPIYALKLRRNEHHKIIYTTAEHLWQKRGCKRFIKTVDLKFGDRLNCLLPKTKTFKINIDGVRHGYIYGDGSKMSKNFYKVFFYTEQKQQVEQIYFKDCKKIGNYSYYNYPGRIVPKKEFIDYKALPSTDDLDYLYSFIVGWFAADGNIAPNGVCSFASAKESDIDFLINNLHKLGMAHFGKRYRKRPAKTTYCDAETHLWSLSLVNSTIPNNFFIRKHCQNHERKKTFDRTRWVVEGVVNLDKSQEVFCCETSTQTFALKDFILTHNCFSCGAVGTFEEFVSACFGYDDKGEFGKKWLIENYVSGDEFERPDVYEIEDEETDTNTKLNIFSKLLKVQAKKEVEKSNYVSEEELASYRFYHPYMWQRHLTPEVVEKYDVGFQKDFVVYEDKEKGYKKTDDVLTFPCRDINGNCLFVSRRSVKSKNFYLPTDIDKPLYGVYELPKGVTDVVICESVFNALTCATWNIPALAMFGTGSTPQYEQLLKLPVRHYVIGLDPDDAGDKGSYKLKKYLGKEKELTKLIIPKGKDINDLMYDEFIGLQEIAFN